MHTCSLLLAGLYLVVSFGDQSPGRTTRSRHEFFKLIKKVEIGMPRHKVKELLGEPDDVVTLNDQAAIKTDRTKEIWAYGSNGHLTLATLGSVYIDNLDRVQYVFGNKGSPPMPGILTEEELCPLLALMHQAPLLDGFSYNPLPVIRITNALQAIGKAKALVAIEEYLRITPNWHGEPREGLFVFSVFYSTFRILPAIYLECMLESHGRASPTILRSFQGFRYYL